jgi:SAM-dependent methyltransferase
MSQNPSPSLPTTEKTFSSYKIEQGKAYAEARPQYSPSLYQAIIEYHTSTNGELNTLLDVGCGPGMVARTLGERFSHSIGLDPSEGMIATARSLGGSTLTSEPVRFEISTAEDLGASLSNPIQDSSVDLITAANAAHWFNMPEFWPRAARVLKPGGSVVLWCSGRSRIHPSVPNAEAIQATMDEFEEQHLKAYFAEGNLLTRNRYIGLTLPWDLEQQLQEFDESAFIRKEWNVEEDFFVHQMEMTLDKYELVMASASPIVRWREAHPETLGTEDDIVKMSRRIIERLLHEAGVEKGKEVLRAAMQGVVLVVKKRSVIE